MRNVNSIVGHVVSGLAAAVVTVLIAPEYGFEASVVAFLLVFVFSLVPDIDIIVPGHHRSWYSHSFWLVVPFQYAGYHGFIPIEYSIYVTIGILAHLIVDLIEYPFGTTTFDGFAVPYRPTINSNSVYGMILWIAGLAIPIWLHVVILFGLTPVPFF